MPNKMSTRRIIIGGLLGFLIIIFMMNSSNDEAKQASDKISEAYDEFENSYMMSRQEQDRLTDECDRARPKDDHVEKDILEFESFNYMNHPNSKIYVVPNYVHLIYLNSSESLTFDQMIQLFSIILNHKPRKILIHCDGDCSFQRGPYWEKVESSKCLNEKLVIRKIPGLIARDFTSYQIRNRLN